MGLQAKRVEVGSNGLTGLSQIFINNIPLALLDPKLVEERKEEEDNQERVTMEKKNDGPVKKTSHKSHHKKVTHTRHIMGGKKPVQQKKNKQKEAKKIVKAIKQGKPTIPGAKKMQKKVENTKKPNKQRGSIVAGGPKKQKNLKKIKKSKKMSTPATLITQVMKPRKQQKTHTKKAVSKHSKLRLKKIHKDAGQLTRSLPSPPIHKKMMKKKINKKALKIKKKVSKVSKKMKKMIKKMKKSIKKTMKKPVKTPKTLISTIPKKMKKQIKKKVASHSPKSPKKMKKKAKMISHPSPPTTLPHKSVLIKPVKITSHKLKSLLSKSKKQNTKLGLTLNKIKKQMKKNKNTKKLVNNLSRKLQKSKKMDQKIAKTLKNNKQKSQDPKKLALMLKMSQNKLKTLQGMNSKLQLALRQNKSSKSKAAQLNIMLKNLKGKIQKLNNSNKKLAQSAGLVQKLQNQNKQQAAQLSNLQKQYKIAKLKLANSPKNKSNISLKKAAQLQKNLLQARTALLLQKKNNLKLKNKLKGAVLPQKNSPLKYVNPKKFNQAFKMICRPKTPTKLKILAQQDYESVLETPGSLKNFILASNKNPSRIASESEIRSFMHLLDMPEHERFKRSIFVREFIRDSIEEIESLGSNKYSPISIEEYSELLVLARSKLSSLLEENDSDEVISLFKLLVSFVDHYDSLQQKHSTASPIITLLKNLYVSF